MISQKLELQIAPPLGWVYNPYLLMEPQNAPLGWGFYHYLQVEDLTAHAIPGYQLLCTYSLHYRELVKS